MKSFVAAVYMLMLTAAAGVRQTVPGHCSLTDQRKKI